jgi:ribosome biogenesis protein YTM1
MNGRTHTHTRTHTLNKEDRMSQQVKMKSSSSSSSASSHSSGPSVGAAGAAGANSVNIRVRFITKYDQYRISDAPFAVPNHLGRHGLSEVVNHLLGASEDSFQPFDFLIESQLLRTTVAKFLLTRKISSESIVVIEYMPALTLSEESEGVEVPAWVGSLNCSVPGKIFAGCFDGKVQILDRNTLAMIGCIEGHADPITSIEVISAGNDRAKNVLSSSESGYFPYDNESIQSIVCTGSKDQSIKCFAVGKDNASLTSHVASLIGHTASVESVRFDSANSVLLSGDWSGNLFGWDLRGLLAGGNNADGADETEQSTKKKQKGKSGKARAVLPPKELKHTFFIRAHAQSVSSIYCVPESKRAFTASWDHSIREWDLETQDSVVTMAGSKVCTSCDYSQNARLLLSSHPDGRVRLWDSRQPDSANACVNSFAYKSETSWISQVCTNSQSHYDTFAGYLCVLTSGVVESIFGVSFCRGGLHGCRSALGRAVICASIREV